MKGKNMKGKKILVLGGTGAMGQYLVPALAERGAAVTVSYINDVVKPPPVPGVKYVEGNAKDVSFLRELLKEGFDAIVDFLVYPTRDLIHCLPFLTENTDHYIYLSTYRIYDNKEIPIKETSPRLLDSTEDIFLKNSDDYSIYKARGENILHALPRKNWTIIRPAITYSLFRNQLVTLEAAFTVGRAFQNKKTALPLSAKNIQGTMTWAGDVAQMIKGLLFNEKAMGEAYTVATAEHHSWGEIADYYKDICGLESVWVDDEDYIDMTIKIMGYDPFYGRLARYQLIYDRLFDRIIDNSKILGATGMKQEELMPLYKGLELEINRCPKDHDFHWDTTPMDELLTRLGYQ